MLIKNRYGNGSHKEHSMDTQPSSTSSDFVSLTADVVSAYVANNATQARDLSELISQVHASFVRLSSPQAEAAPEPLTPPVSIKKSITPDYLISLEDGKRYKSLKRHLTGRGLTPEQYRQKWGLRSDYPMVAPNYAKQRSELARASGLGQQRRKKPGAASKAARRGAKEAAA